ncbi:MAG: urea ABC transporter permease subunit UrtB, partial [Oscillospiraceae bacterium]
MAQFVNTLFNGLSLSSIILLTSLGLAITFGLMRVINMAHGEFVMIGAYTTYVVQEIFKSIFPESMRDIYYFAAIPAAFAVTFLLGSLLERFVIQRLYGREIDSLLATWGISLILQQA